MKNKNKAEAEDFDYRPHRAGADSDGGHPQWANLARTNGWFYSPWRRLDRLDQWFADHPRVEKTLMVVLGLMMIALVIHHALEF